MNKKEWQAKGYDKKLQSRGGDLLWYMKEQFGEDVEGFKSWVKEFGQGLKDQSNSTIKMIKSLQHYLTEESVGYAKLASGQLDQVVLTQGEQSIEAGLSEIGGGVGIYNDDTIDRVIKGVNAVSAKKQMFGNNEDTYFEILYSFSDASRGSQNGYGAVNWTARTLYEFLCSQFNGGEYFVDTYLKEHFEDSTAYWILIGAIREVQINVLDAQIEAYDKGRHSWNKLYGEQKRGALKVQTLLKQFERLIKEEIIMLLRSGLIRTNLSGWTDGTKIKRAASGFSNTPFTPFYASGFLINQITFNIILKESLDITFAYSDSYAKKHSGAEMWQV